MVTPRIQAALPALAFALLAAVLATSGAVPWGEAAWAALAVTLALLPSGWLAPAGWRRRAAEAVVLLPAFALVLVADPTMRRMVLPPLLLLLALAAAKAGLGRAGPAGRPWLIVALALAARAACGLAFVGVAAWRVALVSVAVAALAWAGAHLVGEQGGTVIAVLAGTLPLERLTVAFVVASIVLACLAALARGWNARRLCGWLPGALALALAAAALSPWGGIAPAHALPALGTWSAVATGVCLAATLWLPPAAAGAAWLAVTLALGAVQPTPPDRAAITLDAAHPQAVLAAGDGRPYLLDATLGGKAEAVRGATVATLRVGERAIPLRAGVEVATAGGHGSGAPASAVWRPAGVGAQASWTVAARTAVTVGNGVVPEVQLAAQTPASLALRIATAGPTRPTPPRDWPLPAWVLATAVAVALLQLAAGAWRRPAAVWPWALLAAGSLVARMPVEPLHLLAERHAVDLALAATLLAWFPLARRALARERVFVAAASLLLPLAIATPHLAHPVGDENYQMLLLSSLRNDHDLDIANNLDIAHNPQQAIYAPFPHTLLQSPVLALLLLPGYLVAGRSGACIEMALAGAALVTLLHRAARRLGVPQIHARALALVLLLGFPLATFSTQLWAELPGALLVALALGWTATAPPRAALVSLATVVGVAMKTRFGLVLAPLLAAAWWPRAWRWRELRRPLFVGLTTLAAGLALAWALLGDPLDPLGRRTLASLLPHSPRLAALALGGLAFDPVGGLLFSAPLGLAALAGCAALWRRGGWSARALLLGAVATVLPLLNLVEWRGGDAPPARYLVPLLPAFALAGVVLLHERRRLRPLAWALLPPSLLVSWAFVTRPFLGVSAGYGGFWLSDLLARRFNADARHLFPSFLRTSSATWGVPAAVLLLGGVLCVVVRRWPASGRALGRGTVAVWLVVAAAFIVVLTQRYDHVVDAEDPQVVHLGGRLEPPVGTFARFTFPNGWRVGDGEGVEASLHLPRGARIRIEGWATGSASAAGTLLASWDKGATSEFGLAGWPTRPMILPAPAEGGRHRLTLLLRAPAGGEVVLDRLVVVGP
jgi:hypothetical protein